MIHICEECQREFTPAVPGQCVCTACLIKPHRSESKVKNCIDCKNPFEPSGNAQKRCPECRAAGQAAEDMEPMTIKHTPDPVQQTLKRFDKSFEAMAGELMQLAGVRKMQLCYDKFKVTIELVIE